MTRMTDNELQHQIDTKQRELLELQEEKLQRHRDKFPQEHLVLIHVRGLETTRECYCWTTNGRDHYESESPWIDENEKPVKV